MLDYKVGQVYRTEQKFTATGTVQNKDILFV